MTKGTKAPSTEEILFGLSMASLLASCNSTQMSAHQQLPPCQDLRGKSLNKLDIAGDKG